MCWEQKINPEKHSGKNSGMFFGASRNYPAHDRIREKIPVPEHVPENTAHHCNLLIHQTRFRLAGFFEPGLRQRVIPTVTRDPDGMQILAFMNF